MYSYEVKLWQLDYLDIADSALRRTWLQIRSGSASDASDCQSGCTLNGVPSEVLAIVRHALEDPESGPNVKNYP